MQCAFRMNKRNLAAKVLNLQANMEVPLASTAIIHNPLSLCLTTWLMVRQEVHTLGIGTGNARASRTGPGPNIP